MRKNKTIPRWEKQSCTCSAFPSATGFASSSASTAVVSGTEIISEKCSTGWPSRSPESPSSQSTVHFPSSLTLTRVQL